jgi:hypothetical protein
LVTFDEGEEAEAETGEQTAAIPTALRFLRDPHGGGRARHDDNYPTLLPNEGAG